MRTYTPLTQQPRVQIRVCGKLGLVTRRWTACRRRPPISCQSQRATESGVAKLSPLTIPLRFPGSASYPIPSAHDAGNLGTSRPPAVGPLEFGATP